jgi:hypothetical protein
MVQARADGLGGQAVALPVCAAESTSLLARGLDDREFSDAIARRSSVPAVDALGAAAGGLDLHEELCGDRATEGCSRWPEKLWLISDMGHQVRGRCKATNLCAYCAKLAAVENTEMLALDAMEGNAPCVWLVLTTSRATTKTAEFYGARRELMRALRDHFGDVQYASLLEFTTGYGPRSGGRRRPHWNVMLKGVTLDDIPAIRALVAAEWCPRVGGKPQAQHVGQIAEAGGLMRYIALHFQKESQAPPRGFKGQRFNCSQRYFTGHSRAEMRQLARGSLREKRAIRRAEQAGYEGAEALAMANEELADAAATVWSIYIEEETTWERLERLLPTTGQNSSGTEPSTGSDTTAASEQSALFDGSTATSTAPTAGNSESEAGTRTAGGGSNADGTASRRESSGSEEASIAYDLLAMGASWAEIERSRPTPPPAPNARQARAIGPARTAESRAVVRDLAAPGVAGST